MQKNILLSYFIIILLFGLSSPYIIWENVDKGGLEQCPQASNLNSTKSVYLENQSLPLVIYTPAQNATWCKKSIPTCSGYSPCSQTFITNYSMSMIGFNIEFIWHHSEPQSCLGNDNHWAIFYNQDACYSGGVEYGIVYFVCKKKLAFYYSIDSNWKTQKWVDKPITYVPVEGKNYLRVKLEMVGAPITATQVSGKFNLSWSSSKDGINYSTQMFSYKFEKWSQECRYGPGRLTATIHKESNEQKNQTLEILSVQHGVETDFLIK